MFPAQTSLIPVTVALSKYIAENGFEGLYPFWYFGTTPTKYLIGPVVPILLNSANSLTGIGLFNLSILFAAVSIFVSAFGWGMFAGRISASKKIGFAAAILSLALPWHWFSAFGLSELSAILAESFTGWLLYLYCRFLRGNKRVGSYLILSLVLSLILLTNSTAAFVPIVGFLILGIVLEKEIGSAFKKIGVIVAASWLRSEERRVGKEGRSRWS